MRHAFPYRSEPQDSGLVLVQFVDVPEAHTSGASEAEAGGERALDCLVAALGGYVKLSREIPGPISPAGSACRRRPFVASSTSTIARTSTRSIAPLPRSASASRCVSWSRRDWQRFTTNEAEVSADFWRFGDACGRRPPLPVSGRGRRG
jgi:hypothetical protein